MGRTAYKHKNLPKNMRIRVRGSKTYYYYDLGGRPRKEISLGSDYLLAIKKWTEMEMDKLPKAFNPTFNDAFDFFKTKKLLSYSQRSQEDIIKDGGNLLKFFDAAPLDEIEPQHIRQYLQWRIEESIKWCRENNRATTPKTGQVRANREIALFSVIFNTAREFGITNQPNPSQGVSRYSEKSREVYIEDNQYKAIWDNANQPLRDAMDLAYLLGQRPGDIIELHEDDVKDGFIFIQQNKTGQKLRIVISDELQSILNRIKERKAQYKIVSGYLICNLKGEKTSVHSLSQWFNEAKEKAGLPKSLQFRDLRAKAGTDKAEKTKDARAAQKQLGHKRLSTTEHYLRNRLGDKVLPTK